MSVKPLQPVYQIVGMLILMALVLVGAGPTPLLGSAAAPLSDPSTGVEARSEVLALRVYFRDHAERDLLAYELGAEEIATLGGFLTVYSTSATYHDLMRRGIRVEVDHELTKQANPDLSIPNPFYGGYLTTQEIETFLDQKVSTYPALAEKIDIGDSWCKTHPGQCTQPNSWNGYDLSVLRITNRSITGPKPVFWLDAGIHPNEIATPEVAIRFINWLLDGYNSNPDAHWLVDNHEIWVMPVLNPDGHHIVSSGGSAPYAQRKNADNDDGCATFEVFGTDLNRNFPFKWGCCMGSSGQPCDNTYRGPSAGSEVETQAIMAKIQQIIPDQRGPNNTDAAPITTTGIYQSMHTNAELNLYAWGWTEQPSPNNADIGNIGAHMSALNADGNGYESCQPSNCLYRVDGATLDWSYGELGIPGFTTELSGHVQTPQYSCLDNPGCGSTRGIWPENKGMLIYQAKIARMPYLLTRGPDANLVTSTPMTVTQGTPSVLTSTINYAWTGNAYLQNVAAAEYYVDTPPWAGGTPFPMAASDGSYNSPTEGVEAMIATGTLGVGRHLILVRGRGTNDYEGHQSWGPISAAFLDVLPGITPTPGTNTPVPATATATVAAPTTTASTGPATSTNTAVVPTRTGTPTPAAPTTTASASTAVPVTSTATRTIAPPTATACTVSFTDVPTSNTFYANIRCLACHGILGGYSDGTFHPNNEITRGQITKVVSNAAGFNESPGDQLYEDVPPSNTFYVWINRLSRRGHMGGYICGGVGEPCGADNKPYFRPNANATRGQLAKIVASAAQITGTPTGQRYADVEPDSTFYLWIEQLSSLGVMGGYECGTVPTEPCDDQNRPYFRPFNNVTRGQASKIVTNTFFPGCETPWSGK
ncbi:MAG TPA: M14 family zinc carboxypeptidase [Chloroflexia bacterium]|nr:M14 family zinc carboxypeptidase [Chloroflexia bacterium]